MNSGLPARLALPALLSAALGGVGKWTDIFA